MDMDLECRPTFEQLSLDRIVNEAHHNLNMLKALDNILADRIVACNQLNAQLTKSRTNFEAFDRIEGTLKYALDTLFIFTEQVSSPHLLAWHWLALIFRRSPIYWRAHLFLSLPPSSAVTTGSDPSQTSRLPHGPAAVAR